MRTLIAAALMLALTACGLSGTDGNDEDTAATATPAADQNGADSMASNDPAEGQVAQVDIPDPEQRPVMQLQVVLDRQGFGPGVIDGEMGMSTTNAISGFQEANRLQVTGELDQQTRAALARWSNIPATRVVRIPEDWGRQEYRPLPEDPAEQAQLQRLGYESLEERLAERFHTTAEVLRQLNPGGRPAGMAEGGAALAEGGEHTAHANAQVAASAAATASPAPAATATAPQPNFAAGQLIRVPNIGADRIDASAVQDKGWQQTLASLGVGTDQPEVRRIVVDESEGWLKGYDAQGRLVAMFTVTTGSSNDPLPLGTWGITGISYNPPFSYDPELFWDVPDTEEKQQQLPPGPNGPVGVVWIDLTKEHYGIHGTNAPETIGRAQSHGCVRLTNWDAARLAEMVDTSTEVIFQA